MPNALTYTNLNLPRHDHIKRLEFHDAVIAVGLIHRDQFIYAVKYIRHKTGMSLRDAKEIADKMRDRLRDEPEWLNKIGVPGGGLLVDFVTKWVAYNRASVNMYTAINLALMERQLDPDWKNDIMDIAGNLIL